MRPFSSLHKITYTALAICLGLTFTACKDSKKKAAPFEIKLGKPGESEVKNEIPINDRVHPLTEDESIEFISDDGRAIIKHNKNRKLDRDDILIGNNDQKYLVRIKEIIKKDNNTTEVILRQSRIGELIGDETGALEIETTPIFFPDDINKLNRKAKRDNKFNKKGSKPIYEVDANGKITIKNLELFSFNLNDDGKAAGGLNKIMGIVVKDPYEKFSLSGSTGGKYSATINEATIEVVPTLRSNSKWSFGKISKLETRFDTKVKYRVDITYDFAGAVSLEGLIDFLPKKVIPIKMGTPPVYVDIELGIPAGVKITAEKSGKTRIVYETEYEFYSTMNYKAGEKIKTTKNQRVLINETRIDTTNTSTKLEAELFLKPQVTARLYRVVGPYAYLKPYVRGEVEWPSVEKKDDLFVGVTGGVGIELSEPIFLNSIVSYESGDIFNFYKSFDLDKKGEKASAVDYGQPDAPDVVVDQLGPEGFVVINLKEKQGQESLRFELVNSTKTGLLIPSENFYFSGQLYYYPLSHSEAETFKINLIGKGGKTQALDVSLNPSAEAIKEASKDRFSITSNSYKVTTGKADDFAASVPSHSVEVGINTIEPQTINQLQVVSVCNDSDPAIKEAMETYEVPCQELTNALHMYRRAKNNNSFNNKVARLTNTATSTSFNYVNQYNLNDYLFTLNGHLTQCQPGIKTEVVNNVDPKTNETDIGLRITEETCGLVKEKINTEDLKKVSLFGIAPKLIDVTSSTNGSKRTHEMIIAYKVLEETSFAKSYARDTLFNDGTDSFILVLPNTDKKNTALITSKSKYNTQPKSKFNNILISGMLQRDLTFGDIFSDGTIPFSPEAAAIAASLETLQVTIKDGEDVKLGLKDELTNNSIVSQNLEIEEGYTDDEQKTYTIKNSGGKVHQLKNKKVKPDSAPTYEAPEPVKRDGPIAYY